MKLVRAQLWHAPRMARIMGNWVREVGYLPVIHTRSQDTTFCRGMILRFDVTVARTPFRTHGFLAQSGEKIHALYLAPKARRKGVGSALIEAAKAQSDRLELWCFQANASARAFYARHGFQEIEMTDGADNDEKIPDVRLEWSRDPR